jgi:hypothetical protein
MFIVQLCLLYSLHVTGQLIYLVTFLDALAKLRKATIGFGISVCPVCLSIRMEKLCSNWTDFRDI